MQMESSLYKLLSRKKEDNVKKEPKIKINNLEEMQKNKNFKKFTKDFIVFIQRNEKDDFNREKLNNCMSIKNFFSNLGKQKIVQMSWKIKIMKYLNQISNCFWSKKLIKTIEKINNKNDRKYQIELLYISYAFQNNNEINEEILKNFDVSDSIEEEFYDLTPLNKNSEKICYKEKKNDYDNNTLILNRSVVSTLDDFQEKKETKNKKNMIKGFKLITQKIESHLLNPDHSIAIIKAKFLELFFKNFETNQSLNNYQNMIQNLQNFINFFIELIIKFYNLEYFHIFLTNQEYLTKENIKQFITSLILNDEKIYNLLIETNKSQNENFENKLLSTYKLIESWQIEDFGISIKFMLNDITINNLPNYLQKNKNMKSREECRYYEEEINKKSMLILFENDQISEKSPMLCFNEKIEDLYNEYDRKLVSKTMIMSEKIIKNESKTHTIPYLESISNLQKINNYKSPIHKLKNIIQTAILVIDCIKNFYMKNKCNFDEIIDADEIMCIFIYICCKARIPHIYSQCSFIESFMSNKLSNSISGYYLITLKASLECIADEEFINKLDKKARCQSIKNCLR